MWKKIIVILLLIVLIIFGTYFIQHRIMNGKINDLAEVVTEESQEPIPDDITINMTVTGDVICHNTNFWDAYDASTDSYDFSYSFEGIKKYFESADICVGTLESNFAGKSAGYSNYPLFNAPEDMAKDLKELGYDVMATANNHCLDKGFSGLVNTLSELDKAGIEHLGTYATEEASKEFLVKDVKGIKIGFLDYTYGTNGIPLPVGKEFAINMIDKEKIKSDMEEIRKLDIDVLCVFMHWGQEYRLTPTDEQKQLADFLFENGADLILGSHTHCLEPMEKRTVMLEDGTTKDGFIIYSLGNFMSGQNADHSRQSVILDIKLTKAGKDGKISIDYVTYTPIYMFNYYTSKSAHRFKVMDIEDEIARYEADDVSIGASMYNTLKKELKQVYEIVGPELVEESEKIEEEE